MAEMMRAYWAGDPETARRLNAELIGLYDAMSVTANPIPVKAAMELVGHPAGPPRLPLPEATPDEVARIREAMRSAGMV
jgi:4-hydroxy-tetrahydrodipicolinate synthase